MKSTTTRYGKGAQLLHWLSAFFILLLIPMGFAMARMAEGATQTNLYQMHVALGLLVLLLTAIRIIWRVMGQSPARPAQIKGMRRLAFSGIHILQYLVLILTLTKRNGTAPRKWENWLS